MKRLLLLLIIFLSACGNDCPPITEALGEPYFELECAWEDPNNPLSPPRQAIWRCGGDVQTPLLTGFVFLELEHTDSLHFCGSDLILESHIEIYDNLVGFLTRDKYDCLHITEDREKGNQFDWSWNDQTNMLQLIWRPEDGPHQMMTLVVEAAEYDTLVKSTVYYTILD